MILVKTKLASSPIHGIGIFADEFIPKGTEVWKFTNKFDSKFTADEILNYPPLLQIHIYKYAWLSKKSGLYCLSSDNAKFFNHSDTPNCLSEYRDSEEEVVTVACRDINPGEEMTDNYSSFEDERNVKNDIDMIAQKYGLEDEVDPRTKNKLK